MPRRLCTLRQTSGCRVRRTASLSYDFDPLSYRWNDWTQ